MCNVILNLGTIKGEWSASLPDHFTPEERVPGTHWIGCWVDQKKGKVPISFQPLDQRSRPAVSRGFSGLGTFPRLYLIKEAKQVSETLCSEETSWLDIARNNYNSCSLQTLFNDTVSSVERWNKRKWLAKNITGYNIESYTSTALPSADSGNNIYHFVQTERKLKLSLWLIN
jgi:hypothetical protein